MMTGLNRKRLFSRLAAASLLVLAAPLFFAGNVAAKSGDVCERIGDFVDPYVELAMFNGVILVKDKKKTHRCHFGLANYETGETFDDETRFRIASVSKTITDIAIAKLVEAGALSLDDPIAKFLPDFPKADGVTLRQILDHRSGIPHTNRQEWGKGLVSMSLDEILERLAALPFDFEPGEDSQYSNGGYAVAAKILEIATGKNYGDAMDHLVFAPLEMKNTGHLDDVRRPDPKMAIGYEPGKNPGSLRYTRFYAAEMRPGGGSLYSTPSDLLLLLEAIRGGGFLSEHSMSDVLGFEADEFVLSQGRSPGFVSNIYRNPAGDLTIISLANNYSIPSNWMDGLLAALEGEDPAWLSVDRADELIEKDHGVFGTYASNFGGTVEIKWDNGAAYFEDDENQIRSAFLLLEDGDFLLPIYYAKCRFDEETENVGCEILSGKAAYTYDLTRIQK